MNPSSLRSSAIFVLSLEAGTSTFSCSARLALRIRVSRSAIGSLIMVSPLLPARLDHARHLAPERQLAEADPAHLELPEVSARASAQAAPPVSARLELGRTLLLHDQRSLGHLTTP